MLLALGVPGMMVIALVLTFRREGLPMCMSEKGMSVISMHICKCKCRITYNMDLLVGRSLNLVFYDLKCFCNRSNLMPELLIMAFQNERNSNFPVILPPITF